MLLSSDPSPWNLKQPLEPQGSPSPASPLLLNNTNTSRTCQASTEETCSSPRRATSTRTSCSGVLPADSIILKDRTDTHKHNSSEVPKTLGVVLPLFFFFLFLLSWQCQIITVLRKAWKTGVGSDWKTDVYVESAEEKVRKTLSFDILCLKTIAFNRMQFLAIWWIKKVHKYLSSKGSLYVKINASCFKPLLYQIGTKSGHKWLSAELIYYTISKSGMKL